MQEAAWIYTLVISTAYADCAKLPEAERQHVRYLDISSLHPDRREVTFRVLSGHINGLSRSSERVQPLIVPNANLMLLRISLLDYKIDPKVWERLSDPWWWQKVGDEWVYGNWFDAKGKEWLGLVQMTGSVNPIVRGDWFFSQTAIQADRKKAGYYDFLGIANQKDYQELIGFDAELAKRFGQELRAAVARSGVTQQARALVRLTATGGGYWLSLDSRKAVGDKNPLQVLGGELKFEFSEEIAFLPNELLVYGLFNAEGGRADSAPDFIATDHMTTSNDGRIHVNFSCVRCHGGDAGIKPIADFHRKAFAKKPLVSPDPEKLRELRRLYLRDMEYSIGLDRAKYARALKLATGLDPAIYAGEYARLWQWYVEDAYTTEKAAQMLSMTTESLEKKIAAYEKARGGNAILPLAGLEQGIGVDQFEEILPVLLQIVSETKKDE